MCHSGYCSWESGNEGECILSNNIRKKYNLICEICDDEEYEVYIKSKEYQERLKKAHKESAGL